MIALAKAVWITEDLHMKANVVKACKRILFILPVFLSVYGLCIRGEESLIDALFNSLLMYVFCYAENPANWAVEAARWMAPLMTASGILAIVQTLRDRIHHFLLFKSGKSIAVYGLSVPVRYVIRISVYSVRKKLLQDCSGKKTAFIPSRRNMAIKWRSY